MVILDPNDLGPMEQSLLRRLYRPVTDPAPEVDVPDLAIAMRVHPYALLDVVQKLEGMGLVSTASKYVRVWLTTEGRMTVALIAFGRMEPPAAP